MTDQHPLNYRGFAAELGDRLGLSQAEARRTLDAVLNVATDALVTERGINITGFGSLKTYERPARTARNPQTGEALAVPATKRVKYAAGQRLLGYVNGEFPTPADGVYIRKAPKQS